MTHADTNPFGRSFGTFLASSESKAEQRKQKALAREKQREEEPQVAKELKESGRFNQDLGAHFHGYFYYL